MLKGILSLTRSMCHPGFITPFLPSFLQEIVFTPNTTCVSVWKNKTDLNKSLYWWVAFKDEIFLTYNVLSQHHEIHCVWDSGGEQHDAHRGAKVK